MKVFLSLFLAVYSMFFGYSSNGDFSPLTEPLEMIKIQFSKDKIISETHNGTPSDYHWSESDEYTSENAVTLIKEKGRDFKILNITDIHLSDFGYRVFTSVGAEAVVRSLVKETEPDLIILTGDMVCGDSDYYSIKRITDLMESFDIPWAPIFGNHDDEANCDLDFLAETMMSAPHCIMQKGDPDMGVGNYVINVAEKDGDRENIVETIVMMDSHHSQPNELQQKWLSWVAEGTKKISDGKSELSVFMHIPLPDYETAYNLAFESDESKAEYKAYGEKYESVCCEKDGNGNPLDRGFLDRAINAGNIKYIFCGHDHCNCYSVLYKGIRLTYCMKVGLASGYHQGYDGGTLITLDDAGINCITHKVVSVIGFRDLVTIDKENLL